MRSLLSSALFVSALAAACGDSSGPSGPGPAANLTIVSGNNVEGVAGSVLAAPLAVRVVDASNRPVPGVVVYFTNPLGGGSLSASSATSSAEGVASVTWTLGQVAGEARAQAQVASVTGVAPAEFNVVIRAGPPAALQRISNPPGTSAAGFQLADSVAIRVTDSFGNPIEDASISFAVTLGGGAVSHASRNTNALGQARVAWHLGSAGPQTLRAALGTNETLVTATAQACTETSIAPGDVLTVGPGDPSCVVLAGIASRYLVTVVNAAPAATNQSGFRLRGAGASSGAPDVLLATAADTRRLSMALTSAAAREQVDAARERIQSHDTRLRANELLLQQLLPRARAVRSAQSARRLNSMVAAVPPTAGDTLTLRIPTNFSNLCSPLTAVTVRARVVFVGQHGVMLEDVAAPLAGQMDSLYQRVGQEFESGMWQLLTTNFGNPLAMDDQTDNNQRFLMLFSQVVNDVQNGTVAGFVSSADFFPTELCAASNLAEIFYAGVPTVPGPSSDFNSPAQWYRRTRTVMMHEAKHIVSFAERISRGYVPTTAFNNADRWLEESTAMLAEELWGRTVFGYQPRSNVTYLQSIYCEVRQNETSFPDCPQPYKPLNIFDHFILLYDYLSSPEALSTIGAGYFGDFSFYGSGWSFLRWVLDNYATSESGFLTALTQEFTLPGVQNIEARTGRTFAELINDWSVAQALDDDPAFAPANSRHRLESWNSRDIFEGMNRDFGTPPCPNPICFFTSAAPLTPRAVSFGNFAVDVAAVRGGSMAVFELTGTQTANQLLEVSGLAGTSFPADMRFNIIRVQ